MCIGQRANKTRRSEGATYPNDRRLRPVGIFRSYWSFRLVLSTGYYKHFVPTGLSSELVKTASTFIQGLPSLLHAGLKSLLTNHLTGSTIEAMASVMCAKSMCARSSLGRW